MSISKRLVELMGGTISVESEEGIGSTFSFTVLLKVPMHPSLPMANPALSGPLAGVPSSHFGGARILIAEDQNINQKLATLQLQELGCMSEAVSNGKEAVNALALNEYAAVLMDCQMPEMDGFEATRAIRNLEKTTGFHIPIIAMTAQAMSGDREQCLASGMDDYISKPVTSKKLEAVLRRWLPQCKNSSSTEAIGTAMAQPYSAGAQLQSKGFVTEQYKHKLAEWTAALGSEIASELMAEFINGIETVIVELEQNIADRDFSAVRMTAHRLTGLCLNLYTDETCNFSTELEKNIEALNWQAIQTSLILIKADFRTLLSCQ